MLEHFGVFNNFIIKFLFHEALIFLFYEKLEGAEHAEDEEEHESLDLNFLVKGEVVGH